MRAQAGVATVLLVGLGLGLWLLGLRAEQAAGWAVLAGVVAVGAWAVLFVDWEPREKASGDGEPGQAA